MGADPAAPGSAGAAADAGGGARKLGIVAGGGELPRRVVDRCLAEGRPFFVFAVEGAATPGAYDDVPHAWFRLGAAGACLRRAQAEAIQDLLLVGPVKRPSLAALRPDATALRILTRIGSRALGDDGLLRALIAHLEREYGWRVIGLEDVLGDELTPAPGRLGRHAPDATSRQDIARGRAVLAAMAAADVGQAVVVQDGIVLGVEAIEGTDALIARCGELRRDGPGGVLVKFAKAGQELRADMPTLGPHTVERARDAGLRGIALEAGRTLLVDRARMIELADAAGLFLVALAPDGSDDPAGADPA